MRNLSAERPKRNVSVGTSSKCCCAFSTPRAGTWSPSLSLRSHALWSPTFFIFPDGWTILPPPGKQETASCSGSNCGLARERNQHCNFGQAGHSVPVGVAIFARVPSLQKFDARHVQVLP